MALRPGPPDDAPDLGSVIGQSVGRRALEIAVAGRHNIAFSGPPGVGKTLLARAAAGLLPSLDESEAAEVSRIHSVAGAADGRMPVSLRRPFRAPHHTISTQALVGGGPRIRPGEASLAQAAHASSAWTLRPDQSNGNASQDRQHRTGQGTD